MQRVKATDLVLYQRLCCLSGGYGVCVPMHYLPGAILGSEDHRDPQSQRSDVLPSADLGLRPFDVHDVGKLGCHILLYDLDANGLTISELRCGMLLGPSNLLPSMRDGANPGRGRAERVSEGHVFLVGEQLLRRPGVAFDELIYRRRQLLEYLVELI
jgi:hypothetical protein